jgi:hypothetical protein
VNCIPTLWARCCEGEEIVMGEFWMTNGEDGIWKLMEERLGDLRKWSCLLLGAGLEMSWRRQMRVSWLCLSVEEFMVIVSSFQL